MLGDLGNNELQRFDKRAIHEAAKDLGLAVPEVYRMVYSFELARDFPQVLHEMYYRYVSTTGREPRFIALGIKEYFSLKYRFTEQGYMTVYRAEYKEGSEPVRETLIGIEILRVAKLSMLEMLG